MISQIDLSVQDYLKEAKKFLSVFVHYAFNALEFIEILQDLPTIRFTIKFIFSHLPLGPARAGRF